MYGTIHVSRVLEFKSAMATWLNKGKVLVIAHRGASAWHPEHTLAAYARAMKDGADFIEPDLVMSRDGVLVARHENEIGASTDVAEHKAFSSRRTQKVIDGKAIEGWFCEDFSMAELRSLRAREPLPSLRGRAEDRVHALATFDEIVELCKHTSAFHGRNIGVIPELKHSSYFRSIGMDLELALLSAWRKHEYLQSAPFGIQSFEVGNLKRLRDSIGMRAGNVFLVQLIGEPGEQPFDQIEARKPSLDYASMLKPAGLADIARYAEVIAPNKNLIVAVNVEGEAPGQPNSLVHDAHSAGLAVHAWTLRPENQFLPPHLRCSERLADRCESGSIREMLGLIGAGTDAIFTDDPALGRRAVDLYKLDAGKA